MIEFPFRRDWSSPSPLTYHEAKRLTEAMREELLRQSYRTPLDLDDVAAMLATVRNEAACANPYARRLFSIASNLCKSHECLRRQKDERIAELERALREAVQLQHKLARKRPVDGQ